MEFSKTVMITGSSGFIGLNIVKRICALGDETKIIAVDKRQPKHQLAKVSYHTLDLKDFESFRCLIFKVKPDIIIHLAARTDLKGETLEDYADNIEPVKNLCEILEEVEFVKTVIFTSSMLAHFPGQAHDASSYDTVYGRSKALGERLVSDANLGSIRSIIVRPTSIWGPEFEEPYINFFARVISGRYFLFGSVAEPKTFGYVGNTVNQILSLAQSEQACNGGIYYLGDTPPMTIDLFAGHIQKHINRNFTFNLPKFAILFLAKVGDTASIFGFNFPLTSFRLRNISTKNIVDLSSTENINFYPKIDIDEGVQDTLRYLGVE
jgi:nucleoside-diphosphate-sugar epimerase